jgi:hypothetical protein
MARTPVKSIERRERRVAQLRQELENANDAMVRRGLNNRVAAAFVRYVNAHEGASWVFLVVDGRAWSLGWSKDKQDVPPSAVKVVRVPGGSKQIDATTLGKSLRTKYAKLARGTK